jgi:hypothetical protein
MKKNWFQRFVDWIISLFTEEYELTIWYVYEITENIAGQKVVKRRERTYLLREITRKTNTHIVGKEKNGDRFEIKTVDAFDYQIRKLK